MPRPPVWQPSFPGSGAGRDTDPIGISPVWFDMMPFSPIQALADGPSVIYQGRRVRPSNSASTPVGLEIRSGDGRKRIAEVPDAITFPKDATTQGGGLFLGPDRIRRIGQLPDGDYLMAFTCGEHVRCSNVARLKIDAKYGTEQEPVLRLVPVPLAPDEKLPSVWLVGTGPKLPDVNFRDSAIAFPSLMVDGTEHTPKMTFWTGPNGLIDPGRRRMRLVRLDNYSPNIESKPHYKVKARVLGFESAEVSLPARDSLGASWDEASACAIARVRLPSSNPSRVSAGNAW